jgi:hypothetical protein
MVEGSEEGVVEEIEAAPEPARQRFAALRATKLLLHGRGN